MLFNKSTIIIKAGAAAILYECRIERFKIAFRGRVSQANAKTETEQATSLVVGGTGLVGGYIVEHLLRRGEPTLALSRAQQGRPGVLRCRAGRRSRTGK
jgi:hypothetical protein